MFCVQVVWDDTEEVGCGMKQCVSGPWIQTLVVCNYSPPYVYYTCYMFSNGKHAFSTHRGNVRSFGSSRPRRPYTSGAPCSRYPSTHSACQNGLCGNNFTRTSHTRQFRVPHMYNIMTQIATYSPFNYTAIHTILLHP